MGIEATRERQSLRQDTRDSRTQILSLDEIQLNDIFECFVLVGGFYGFVYVYVCSLFFIFFMVIKINITSKFILLLGKSNEKVCFWSQERFFNLLLTSYLD